MKMKKALVSLSAVATMSLCLATAAISPAAYAGSTISEEHAQNQNSNNPFEHVYVIMLENNGNKEIVGNPSLPNINSLINNYGFDDNYYGITLPSLPNYVSLISGSTWNTNSDSVANRFNVPTLMDQLESKNMTWKGYFEDMPYPGYTGPRYNSYGPGHNPFLTITDIVGDPAQGIPANPDRLQKMVPYTQLQQDLDNNTVPNFSVITPNLIDDLHGLHGEPQEELYQNCDNFIKNTVQAIESSKSWKTSKSVIYITFDAGTDTNPGPAAPTVNGSVLGGGNIPLIFIDNTDMHPDTIHTYADHYSLLRTIEQNWGLGFLANAGNAQVTTLPIPGEPKEVAGEQPNPAPVDPIE